MIRYHFLTTGTPSTYGNVNVDYDLADNTAQLLATPLTAGLWGTGVWGTAVWGSGFVPSAEWQNASYIGYTFAPVLKAATIGAELQWVASDLVFEVGGVL